ncbi:uncharacterized protein LOC126677416 isoform X2 [Mercurialis annua]|uniref:uncharacterized protein LOC126677416 isoform X2 n=1 Tax=Mercurialis annua TaxID=3986 RepID=UPI00215FAD84|nr:uncharacterized protein LOC126677416 isoform X2 [Mercurialis annua]
MDYDDNDFQSQNLHLGGEGSSKFPSVLRSYALPKFDFDDSLHGSLRFDSLVETEVFLGIESNEDSQWIEDYSRGSSGIQFSSTAAESCAISRHTNVWSEATSSESVEMLLKSVGQEELIPAQSNTKEIDACDELGCIIKQMEPSLKQDDTLPARVGDETNSQTTTLPDEFPENFSVLNDGDVGLQTQVEDSSLSHKGDGSVDESLGDLTVINEGVGLHTAESIMLIDGKCNDVNQREFGSLIHEPLDIRIQEGSDSGAQVDSAVITLQNITRGNDALNDEDGLNNANKNTDENLDVSGIDNRKNQDKEGPVGLGVQQTQVLDAEMVEFCDPHMDNPLREASIDSMEETDTIATSAEEPSMVPEGDPGLKILGQSEVDAYSVSLVAIESNTTVETVEGEYSNLDYPNIVSNSRSSLLPTKDIQASQDKVEDVGSSLQEVCSSAQLVSEINAEGHMSSPTRDGPVQTIEQEVVPGLVNVDQDVPFEEKNNRELPSDGSNLERSIDKALGTPTFGEVSSEKELIDSDGVIVASGSGIHTDAVEHKDVEISSSDTNEKIVVENFAEASLAVKKAVSEVNTCNIENQIEPQAVAIEEVGEDCTKDKEAGSGLFASNANKGDIGEAAIKENDDKKTMNVSGPSVNIDISGAEPSAMHDSSQNTSLIGQEEAAVIVSGGASSNQIAVLSTTGGQGSGNDLEKPIICAPAAVRATELTHKEDSKEQIEISFDHGVSVSEVTDGSAIKVQACLQDPNQNGSSKDESSFSFVVSPVAVPKIDARKLHTFSNVEVSRASPILDGSTLDSGLGLRDTKASQDLSHASPKISDVATPRTGSKGVSERKPRRSSGKATAKETVKKGKPIKEPASVRSERGDKTTSISMSPSGVPQLVQSSDMQRYGHLDSNNVKPFVIATSSSSLPDLNSSVSQAAILQQPFTDLQQVQLRAQIFVYGALIQAMAPDEAYMISAFGGLDGGRSIWENAWRLCIERLHGQKPHLFTPETPVQSRPGARAPDQPIKQSALQSRVVSPIARGSSKGTPVVSPIAPFSSPLWSMSTPSGDTLHTSGMPRGPIMDYQRALSPLHPHQTPAIRNFIGHSPSWLPHASFGGPWVPSPPTSAMDNSSRFSMQLPRTEPIQLTPVKELSVPHSSGAKPTPPVAQTAASATVFPGPSVHDVKIITASASQPSVDPKPRKRKKNNENSGQMSFPAQPQMELVSAPTVTNFVSSSVPVTSPVGFLPKVPTERFILSATPTSSSDLRNGDQSSESKPILSEESLGEVKEAKMQAEIAAAHASSAVSHCQIIWDQLDKQRNSGLLPDVELKLASAAVSVAAAAAVAKAAAAAAKVASNAALQAKLMAEEAFVSFGQSNLCQSDVISLSDGMQNLGKATPASILKGGDGTNSSNSIFVAAREAARKRVEAASAASKRAENMDAIVKAAELAAEAVSQAGKIVAMGDPMPLSELVAAGPEGCWKLAQGASELVSKLNNDGRENMNIGTGEGPDSLTRKSIKVPTDKNENTTISHGKSPILRALSNEDHDRLVDGNACSSANTMKEKGQKGRRTSDLTRNVGMVPEPGNQSRSSIAQDEYEKAEISKEDCITEDSSVEVFKDGSGFKAAWFSAKVLSLQDGKAHVIYSDLTLSGGSEKLREWVPLEHEGDEAPKIRIARPLTVMPFEGTRKRRRAAMGEHTWSIGDRVDARIQDSWWEGVITEKSKTDESVLVNFPAHGETLPVSKWNLRPSLIRKNGEWIEWSSAGESNRPSHEGDTPKEKRPRVRSPVVETKEKDKISKTINATESDDPTLLSLTADEKSFNMGKSSRDGNRNDALRMTRTGLQKEGSRVVIGVPKPGKKRKFMDVSKHYVADGSGQINEANDSTKFARYIMPQKAGTRGWKSSYKADLNEKRAAISKPRIKSGKPPNMSGRTVPQKENLTSTSVSIPDNRDHVAKANDSVNHSENSSEKQNLTSFQSFSTSGATEGPIVFSAHALPSDSISSKKINVKAERVSKGRLAPAGSKLGKIEEGKAFNSNSGKSTSDLSEPRRSIRRIQPTSRLLEGLQSSLMVSKIPSVSHEKGHKSRTVSRGNNHG